MVALPAPELVASLLAPPQLDEVVALEAAIDARHRRHRVDTLLGQLMLDATRPPSRVLAAELADRGFELRRDLMGTALRSMRSVGERGEAAVLVTGDPVVDALAGNPETLGDLGDLPAILDHGHDRLITLLHDAELHQHPPTSSIESLPTRRCEVSNITRNCQRSAETVVQHQPNLCQGSGDHGMSNVNRSTTF